MHENRAERTFWPRKKLGIGRQRSDTRNGETSHSRNLNIVNDIIRDGEVCVEDAVRNEPTNPLFPVVMLASCKQVDDKQCIL